MIIGRYFVSAILRGYLIVSVALLALFGLFAAMDEAGNIGKASYDTRDALLFVTMSLPATLLDLAPFVILLGTIFGLGSFLRTQELLALRTAGISAVGVAGLALVGALIASALFAPIEIAARPLLQQAILFRTSEQSPDGNLLAREGSWITRDQTFVFVGSLIGGQRPSRVSVFEFTETLELERFTHAAEAEIISNEHWRLKDVEIHRIAGDRRLHEAQPELDWRPIWSPATILQEFPLASLSMGELRQHVAFLQDTEGLNIPHAVEFWRRALAPLSAFAFSLLGAALVLSVKPRSGGGLAIVVGIAAAIGAYLFQQISVNAAALAGLPPFAAVALPTMVLVLVSLAGVQRTNQGPR